MSGADKAFQRKGLDKAFRLLQNRRERQRQEAVARSRQAFELFGHNHLVFTETQLEEWAPQITQAVAVWVETMKALQIMVNGKAVELTRAAGKVHEVILSMKTMRTPPLSGPLPKKEADGEQVS